MQMRLHQIRITARLLCFIGRTAAGVRLIRSLRALAPGRMALDAIMGYQRIYPSLSEASRAITTFANSGHCNPENIDMHLKASQQARPSDYAALFHLAPHIARTCRIFDAGGNVGNLYYCYRNYLDFRDDLAWTVLDLPSMLEHGQALAVQRQAAHLGFTGDWSQAEGADILIASGSLHYFETPLPLIVEKMVQKPRFILINRTPLTEGKTVAATQDGGRFRVACMVYNRQELITEFEKVGYNLEDAWRTPDLVFRVPGNPDYDAGPYHGMWLALR